MRRWHWNYNLNVETVRRLSITGRLWYRYYGHTVAVIYRPLPTRS
jgi:hypothetical protein